MSPRITSVVFDVGWVLMHLDYTPLTDFLRKHGADISNMRDVVGRIELERHETGELSGDELLENLSRIGTRPMSVAELRQRWLNMFDPQQPMLSLAERLSERYRVHLLSNVGDLHWAHLAREYGLDQLGHGALPSFIAGVMKPDRAIYAEAERRFGLEPATTIFIDDLAPNVAAARARGWHGIEHSDYATTAQSLARLGVSP